MPYKDKNQQREYQRKWTRDRRAEYRAYDTKIKKQAYEVLGGKCTYCDCDELSSLEINHKDGGGRQERKKGGNSRKLFLDIIKGRRTTDDLELTCRVCNAVHYLVNLKGVKSRWEIKWIPS